MQKNYVPIKLLISALFGNFSVEKNFSSPKGSAKNEKGFQKSRNEEQKAVSATSIIEHDDSVI